MRVQNNCVLACLAGRRTLGMPASASGKLEFIWNAAAELRARFEETLRFPFAPRMSLGGPSASSWRRRAAFGLLEEKGGGEGRPLEELASCWRCAEGRVRIIGVVVHHLHDPCFVVADRRRCGPGEDPQGFHPRGLRRLQ